MAPTRLTKNPAFIRSHLPLDHRTNVRFGNWINHAFFGNDRSDQVRWCHIKRRVVDVNSFRSRLLAKTVSDLNCVSFFDRNSVASGQAQIERTAWGSDVERNVVSFGQYRQRVSSDLVGLLTVSGDSIRPRHDRLNSAFPHHLSRHRIAD